MINYLNPAGIPLIREKVELKWAPDSLLFDSDQNFPSEDDYSSALTISKNEVEKNQTNKNLNEVVAEESKPDITEPEKRNEEVKETIAFTEPKAITLDQAYSLFNRKVVFIDARDVADYNIGHVKNSINIPFDDFDNHKQKLAEISKEKPLVIYCAGTDCDLSHLLANLLFGQGYKQVYVFFGGWNEWLTANYPIENSNQ